MDPEDLAQRLADHFHKPYTVQQHKPGWRDLPLEERYEEVTYYPTPDWTPFEVSTAEDGYPSSRSLTYREIAEAVVKILEEVPQPYEVTLERTPLSVTRFKMKIVDRKEEK